MSDTISVLLVDDHDIVREGLRLILETSSRFQVVGEASDGREALEKVAERQPDVVLLDLRMPRMDGLTAIKHLQQSYPDVAIVILTTYNEDDLMLRGLRAGARGFLLKDTSRDVLLQTIEAAAQGASLLDAEIMARLLDHVRTDNRAHKSRIPSPLTEREQEVLQLVARGDTNKGIAVQLSISARTVKAHLASIYNKLDVDSRAAAIAVAAQSGWLG